MGREVLLSVEAVIFCNSKKLWKPKHKIRAIAEAVDNKWRVIGLEIDGKRVLFGK